MRLQRLAWFDGWPTAFSDNGNSERVFLNEIYVMLVFLSVWLGMFARVARAYHDFQTLDFRRHFARQKSMDVAQSTVKSFTLD